MSLKYFAGIVVLQFVVLFILFLPTILTTTKAFKPFRRGFYCDDESIRYPYFKDSVPFYVVILVGGGGTVLLIIITEIVRQRDRLNELSSNVSIPKVVVNIYVYVGIFLFGVAFDQLITNSAKYLVGRPRPHFIAVCNPDFSKIDCSNYRYIEFDDDSTFCRQNDTAMLRNMRLSFPSGHSSFSAYCAVSFTIYIMLRWRLMPRFAVVRLFLQIVMLVLAILCGLSRISDNKHHPTDVLAGLVSGSLVAIATWRYLLKKEGKLTEAANHYMNHNSDIHDSHIP